MTVGGGVVASEIFKLYRIEGNSSLQQWSYSVNEHARFNPISHI